MRWSAVFLSFLLGCHKQAEITPAPAAIVAAQAPDSEPLPPQATPLARCDMSPRDPLTVSEAVLDGDTILATVQYGGGCRPHRLTACWDTAIDESMPARAGMRIVHDANGDPCGSPQVAVLAIDVSSLASSAPILITVNGHRVRYEPTR